MLATLLATLVLAGAPAEPVCHGQLAWPTPQQDAQYELEHAIKVRAGYGFRSDEAYVRELIRGNDRDSRYASLPVTAAEWRYLRKRSSLRRPGRLVLRYLEGRPGLSGGVSVLDRWPRAPLLVAHVTRDRAVHAARLRKLMPQPKRLRITQVAYSLRRLERVADRINERDEDALLEAGFDVAYASARVATNDVLVRLVTPRTDHAAYFRKRYGPVRTRVKGTEFSELVCVEAGYFNLASDDRTLTVHWIPQDSYAKFERFEVTEYDDRVEIGVVERQPTANDTDGGGPSHLQRRAVLSRPLGDRAVIDAGDRAPLRQFGARPGGPSCPTAGLDKEIARRRYLGLPDDPALVRQQLRRNPEQPFTRAELRYLGHFDRLEYAPARQRYFQRHASELAGSRVVGRYPRKPHLVVWVTRRVRFHQRNLGPRVRVLRSPATAREIDAAWERLDMDVEASGEVVGGYGDAGFYVDDVWTSGAGVLVWLRTGRDDAEQWFRERYGPMVDVIVVSRRWECAEAHF